MLFPVTSGPVPQGPHFFLKLAEKLGFGVVRSNRDVARLVEQRLPLTSLDSLSRHGLTDDEIFSCVIPRRTLVHRKNRQESLTHEESDRAVRVARVIALAEEVFGDDAKAGRWLRKPKERFDGRTPLAVLRTEAGARLVEEWLLQFDFGMAA